MGKNSRQRKAWKTRTEFPLDERMIGLFKQQDERFTEKFGRPPGPDDPVFFNPFADTPETINDEVIEHHMLEAMHKAGTHPALVHAYRKTGRLVSRENAKYLTPDELQEWNDAIDEWYDTHEG